MFHRHGGRRYLVPPALGRWVTLGVPIVAAAAMAGTAFLLLRGTTDVSPVRSGTTPAPAPHGPAKAGPYERIVVAPFKAHISFDEAKPILDARRASLPGELRGKTPIELEAAWAGWVSRHDAQIRARLQRGDEDSLVNFWLYGTTFTALPRAAERDIARLGGRARAEELLVGRLDDLVAGLASPGANERLQFARQVIDRQGIDPTTPAGQDKARVYLVEARARVVSENERYRRTARSAKRPGDPGAELSAYATMYHDRGLSSDTSISADFALHAALEAIKSKGRLQTGSVRRVAVVGPGLDFTDKAEGYDFYPQQTIQPFALIDSLIRLGLATPDDLRLTTFDLSPRVNQHLEAARRRAQGGEAYVLQLPLTRDEPGHQWHPDLVKYWQRVGGRIGEEVEAMAAPVGAGAVRVRSVRVRPAVVMSIVPRDLNIVLERLEPLQDEDRFDLIVATNILVYYDAFEQALALANVSGMLKPGGFFLTNYAVFPSAPMESSASLTTTVFFDRQHNGDTLFWYQRR